MSKIVTDSQHYTDIAAAIREKNGEETTYKPSEMANAIQNIPSGGADFSEVEYKLSNGYTDYGYYFYNRENMTEAPSEILQHTKDCAKFSYMFGKCAKLKNVPLFDTSGATSVFRMFQECEALETIPEINTANVTDFLGMFYGCEALTSIPPLDTSQGTSFSAMFTDCEALTSIPPLDTSQGTSFSNMFQRAKGIVTIGSLDLSAATSITGMFASANSLQNITINGVIKITGLSFTYSTKLTHDSLMSIINALYDYASEGSTSTYTLTLGSTNLAKLTDTEKAIATEKGWTLA